MASPDRDRIPIARWCLALAWAASAAGPARADDPLPRHAVARVGDYRFYHGPGVAAAMSPDGRRVASVACDHLAFLRADATREQADESRVVVLWDAATGERVREWRVPHPPAARPRFSPDGTRVAVGYGREDGKSGVAVYDVATGELRTHLDRPPHGLPASGFTPDGKGLVFPGRFRGTGVVWDLARAKVVRTWKDLEGPSDWVKAGEDVCDTVPSADAGYLASLIDVPPALDRFPGLGEPLPPHVPRPTVLVVSDGATGKPLYRKAFPDDRLGRFTFSADGRRFATGGDAVTVYETATGKELFALAAGSPHAFALSPDGRWAVTHSGASQVRLWDLRTRAAAQDLLPGLTHAAPWAAFSADGAAVVLATGAALRVFDTAAAERLGPRHRTGVDVRFAADGKTLFTTCDELRRSWDVSAAAKSPGLLRSEPRRAWEGVCGRQAVAHSPDGRVFVDEAGRRLRVRDTATGRVVHTLEDDGWRGSFGVFSPDGTRLAVRRYPPARTGEDGVAAAREPEVLRLFDATTGKNTGDVTLEDGPSWVVPAFSADGTTLAWADRAGDAHLHDAATGRRVRTLRSEKPLADGPCSDLDVLFSPGGGHVVVSAYQHPVLGRPGDPAWATLPTRVFDVATGKEVGRFYASTAAAKGPRLSSAAASRDGRLLAVAERGSGAVRVLNAATGTVVAAFAGHRHGVRSLAFAPDGKTLASGGEDGVAYLWDASALARKDAPGK